MKKIALSLMALIIGFTSMAQNNEKKSQGSKEFKRGEKQFKRGDKLDKLNLTEAQRAQVKTLNENFSQQMRELNKQGNITVDEQRAKRKALAQEHREKIQAILTPEQRQQAEQLKEEYKGDFNTGRMGGRGQGERGGRFEDLTKDLNLTAEQSTKIASLNADLKSNMQSLRSNTTLSQEAKKEQLKSLMQKHKSEVEALLTAEQKEQLKSRLKNRPNRAVK